MRTITTILLGLILSVWSVTTIYIDSHAAAYRAIAQRLETGAGSTQDIGYLVRIEQALTDNGVLLSCVRDIVRSKASIRLAVLDAAYRSDDPALQETALAKARDTLLSGLQCYPRDGNLRLRLAMVEYVRGGATSTVQEWLKASFAMAPSEGWIMVPRITFASRLLGAELPSAEEVLRADVQNFVSYARLPEIVDLYVSAGEALRATLENGFDTLEPDRVAAIERTIASKVLEQGTVK